MKPEVTTFVFSDSAFFRRLGDLSGPCNCTSHGYFCTTVSHQKKTGIP